MWLSLHGLRINLVIVLAGAEKADHHHAAFISHRGDQAIVVRLNVKDHPAGFEDARLWMSRSNHHFSGQPCWIQHPKVLTHVWDQGFSPDPGGGMEPLATWL
jgi:hypothetical protein